VYGRWCDGFNVMGMPVGGVFDTAGRGVTLAGLPDGLLSASTDEYDHNPTAVLSFLSGMITVFPGDVITLGRLRGLKEIRKKGAEWPTAEIEAKIDGLETVRCRLRTLPDEYLS
jgi:hypothetical protein